METRCPKCVGKPCGAQPSTNCLLEWQGMSSMYQKRDTVDTQKYPSSRFMSADHACLREAVLRNQ